ncbi:MAG: GTP cyclohydrolase MptA [Promethearchaeota archaeon]
MSNENLKFNFNGFKHSKRDVQSEEPAFPVSISKVGITNVHKIIERERFGKVNVLSATIDVYVDLPASRRGIHMSRGPEVINEVIESAVREKISDCEVLCDKIARESLKCQDKATRAEVVLKADYALPRVTPTTKKPIQSTYDLYASAIAVREDSTIKVNRMIGVGVIGLTACPCGQQLSIDYGKEILSQADFTDEQIQFITQNLPFLTHTQRGRSILKVWLSSSELRVEADELIEIVENAVSSPIYELLKRADEQYVILSANKHPVFVEDVIRNILDGFLKLYKHLPDETFIIARQENYESIHRHNAFAEQKITLGELKNEAENNHANLTDLKSL